MNAVDTYTAVRMAQKQADEEWAKNDPASVAAHREIDNAKAIGNRAAAAITRAERALDAAKADYQRALDSYVRKHAAWQRARFGYGDPGGLDRRRGAA